MRRRVGAAARISLHALRFASSRAATNGAEHGALPLALASFCVWGSNTGVGKTLVSAGIAAHEAARGAALLYVKPVQTGFPADSDGALVVQAVRHAAPAVASAHTLGLHAAAAAPQMQAPALPDVWPRVSSRTLFAWCNAVGPHLAVSREGRAVTDEAVATAVALELRRFAETAVSTTARASQAGARVSGGVSPAAAPLALVETAGGVSSPGPGGTLQCDLLRALRLPAVLVGDGRLGGVSTTLCSLDALALRGYDVAAVVLLDVDGLNNADAIRTHLPVGTPLIALPPAPLAAHTDAASMPSDEQIDAPLAQWLDASAHSFAALAATLRSWHARRVAALQAAPARARSTLWWPFTQHDDVRDDDVTVIDARVGDEIIVHDAAQESLRPLLDACGSWWTQGVSAAQQPQLARVIGHAAGRWGHVMYPENSHEPALELAARLLAGPGRGWAHRTFYSDDGSTAVEIALKMALRAYAVQKGLLSKRMPPLRVLALSGSYHGDTLGAAQAQAPSVFTGPKQAPWYSLRGVFIEPPTALLCASGTWRVVLTPELGAAATAAGVAADSLHFTSQDALFSSFRDATPLGRVYRDAVAATIASAAMDARGAVGAAILEPVLHGASGMVFIDPAFQRAVAAACADAQVPLIADEVFSGLWRLGAPAASHLLGVQPDVACYAKLLTGGTVPLAATLASEAVFDAFRGAAKTDALLHGHSYSAHAIGCAAACASLDMFGDTTTNPNLLPGPAPRLRSLWDLALVEAVRATPGVVRVVCIGTVFAAELMPSTGAGGYQSNAARGVVKRLRKHGIFARPLGNVVYLMVTPVAAQATCTRLLSALIAELHATGTHGDGRQAVVC